jgi:hypothetical protein
MNYIRPFANHQGWSQTTLVELLAQFIEKKKLEEDLRAFFAQRAGECRTFEVTLSSEDELDGFVKAIDVLEVSRFEIIDEFVHPDDDTRVVAVLADRKGKESDAV